MQLASRSIFSRSHNRRFDSNSPRAGREIASDSCCPGTQDQGAEGVRDEPIRRKPRAEVVAGRVHQQILRPTRPVPRAIPPPRAPRRQRRRASRSPGRVRDSMRDRTEIWPAPAPAAMQNENKLRHPLIIVVRAYKKRRRIRTGGRLPDDEDGCVRDGRGWDRRIRNGRLTRDFRQPDTPMAPPLRPPPLRQAEPLLPPEPVFRRNLRPLSWDAREIVGQGFQKSRRKSNGGVERVVTMGRGYTIRHADEKSESSVQVAEVALGNHGNSPSISKLERLTGNALSNDLYEERVSGTAESSRPAHRSSMPEIKRFSYPLPARPSQRPISDLRLDTGPELLPLSPTSTATSHDISPVSSTNSSSVFNSLSAPPAVPATLISSYPSVAAITQANAKAPASDKRSRRLSMEKVEKNATQHIASQFSITRQRLSSGSQPGPSSSKVTPPPSASFGRFTGLNRNNSTDSRISGVSSLSSLQTTTSPVDTLGGGARRSWNGRSVLLIDENNRPTQPQPQNRNPRRRPAPPPPTLPTIASTPSPLSTPTLADPSRRAAARITTSFGPRLTSPRSRTSPPESQDPSPGGGIARSMSNSKASVLSMPSTISSFNTVMGGDQQLPIIGGLSPTPAPRPPPPPPRSRGEMSVFDDDSGTGTGDRKSETSTVLTETSSANLTEDELQAEMARVRERARRASEERKSRRRRDEERERGA